MTDPINLTFAILCAAAVPVLGYFLRDLADLLVHRW